MNKWLLILLFTISLSSLIARQIPFEGKEPLIAQAGNNVKPITDSVVLADTARTNAGLLFYLSPDALPVFSARNCSRRTYNVNSIRYKFGTVYSEAGTDTAIVKRIVNGKPYIMFSLDSSQSCTVHRSELRYNNETFTGLPLNADSIFWIGEAKLIPSAWTIDSTPVVISQIHGGSTTFLDRNSPPYSLLVVRDSLFVHVAYNKGVDSIKPNATRVVFTYFVGKVPFGQTFSYVAQVRFAAYPRTDGYVRVWINDQLMCNYTGPFGYQLENAPYYKVGIYKWQFFNGYDYHVAPGVQSAKISYYQGASRYGKSNSTYQTIRPPVEVAR
jgi:hypothetical protein